CSFVRMIRVMVCPPWPQHTAPAHSRSMPNEPRVQRPRLVHVACPLDDRPAVGEDGELVALDHELEQKAVVAHLALRLQVMGQLLEVELARAAVRDLHGVATAKTGRLRAVRPFEPFELAALTARAIDLAEQRRDLDAPL